MQTPDAVQSIYNLMNYIKVVLPQATELCAHCLFVPSNLLSILLFDLYEFLHSVQPFFGPVYRTCIRG
jgi:hypothetical protein